MGKIEREHEDLLLNALFGLVKLHQENDIYNDREALNKVHSATMMMETLLYPYFGDFYHPKLTGEEIPDLHARLRNLLVVAKKRNLVTPQIIREDITNMTEEDDDYEELT